MRPSLVAYFQCKYQSKLLIQDLGQHAANTKTLLIRHLLHLDMCF